MQKRRGAADVQSSSLGLSKNAGSKVAV